MDIQQQDGGIRSLFSVLLFFKNTEHKGYIDLFYFCHIGGCNEYQEYCGDVHIFNLKTSTWHQPAITGSVSSRYLHSATVFEDKLIIYGGFAKSSDCKYRINFTTIVRDF